MKFEMFVSDLSFNSLFLKNRTSFLMTRPFGPLHQSRPPADSGSQMWIDDWSFGFDEFGDEVSTILSEEVEIEKESQVATPKIIGRPRVRYGTGIEAKRTAQFRCLEVRNSSVLRYLHLNHRPTKAFLIRLVKALIDEAEFTQSNELSKPTRTERRSRSALVLWLERHIQHMLQFFESHPHFH
jgi:hypothetical protein